MLREALRVKQEASVGRPRKGPTGKMEQSPLVKSAPERIVGSGDKPAVIAQMREEPEDDTEEEVFRERHVVCSKEQRGESGDDRSEDRRSNQSSRAKKAMLALLKVSGPGP